jgi:hypothetical protein
LWFGSIGDRWPEREDSLDSDDSVFVRIVWAYAEKCGRVLEDAQSLHSAVTAKLREGPTQCECALAALERLLRSPPDSFRRSPPPTSNSRGTGGGCSNIGGARTGACQARFWAGGRQRSRARRGVGRPGSRELEAAAQLRAAEDAAADQNADDGALPDQVVRSRQSEMGLERRVQRWSGATTRPQQRLRQRSSAAVGGRAHGGGVGVCGRAGLVRARVRSGGSAGARSRSSWRSSALTRPLRRTRSSVGTTHSSGTLSPRARAAAPRSGSTTLSVASAMNWSRPRGRGRTAQGRAEDGGEDGRGGHRTV